MARDDAYVERYSRQLILSEIGPRGQERLAAARVAVAARGAAADRVVAYLAAAGVGTLAVAAEQRALVDPQQPGVHLEPLPSGATPQVAAHHATTPRRAADDASAGFDAALVDADAASDVVIACRRFWIAAGRAAEMPPCHDCTAAALGPAAPVVDALATLRDALLGTVVATEIVKALLAVGTPLTGRVLTYDPETATLVTAAVPPRSACPRCSRLVADEAE